MKLRSIFSLLALTVIATLSATPKYIFYFIGDGMGMGQVMAAQTLNRVGLGNSTPLLMMQFPYAGILETFSASSTVTDSAAAGTALACGKKTNNGMLGVTPDSIPLTSMAKVLHNAGWGVGLVTTVAPDDATPGAFYANVPSRSQFFDIGKQAADCGYEFIAGSAWRGAKDKDGKDTGLHSYIRSKGVDLVTAVADARKSRSKRVFLYSETPFHSGNVGFTIDSIEGALNLPDMTSACIEHLERVSPDNFFVMVEGGNIDHVGHGNDGGTVAIEVLNFDKALANAYEFYLKHPDETVIIVTADHETGGMSVGCKHTGYSSHTEYVPAQRMSKDMFSLKIKKMFDGTSAPSWEDIKQFTAENTGLWNQIKPTDDQERRIHELYDATVSGHLNKKNEESLYASYDKLAAEIYRVLNDNQGFGWTSGSHTGNPVPVYAIGNGMEIFGTLVDNTKIPGMLLNLTGKTLK